MALTPIARRTVAVLAATALLTTGGALSGALTGVAFAAETLTSVTPPGAVNNGTKTFTVTAANSSPEFYPTFPNSQVTVTLRHNPVLPNLPDIVIAQPANNSASCTIPVPPPNDACGRTLSFDADLTNAAPGNYDVLVTSAGRPADSMATPTTEYQYLAGIAVAASGVPVVTDSALYAGGTAPPDGKLEITGSFLAKGSTVEFLTGSPTGSPDSGLTFTPVYDATNGYVSDSVLRGTYSQGSFTPGPHYLRVTNAIGESGTSMQPFYQPKITSITPAEFGQGAVGAPLTLLGDFSPTSSLFVKEAGAATGPAAGISFGSVTVSPDRTTLTTTVSVAGNTATGTRDLTVRGDNASTDNGGGYYKVTNGLTINVSPKVTSVSPTNRGQGFTGDVTVTGTALKSSSVFDFGNGITETTKSVNPEGTSAVVTLAIEPDAGLGARTVKVTNADNGTTTGGTFTVNAKPVITAVSPGSALRGQSKQVTVTGQAFVNGVTLSATPPGLTITNVDWSSATQLTATFTVASNLDSSVSTFDVTATNPDGGNSTCEDCFGVNTLSVSPTAVTNGATSQITVQAPGLTAGSVVKVRLPSATDQGEITGTFVSTPAADSVKVSVPLAKAAAGAYTVTATQGATTHTCTACLQVLATSAPANLTVTPSNGGAGAVERVITITGDGLSRGQTVSFGAGVTTVSTTYQATTPDSLRVVITIAGDATPGSRDVTVTNVGEPLTKGTKAGGFTVNAAPATTTVAPDKIGQGGTRDITLTGTGYQSGATADFGPGTTSVLKSGSTPSATSMVFTVSVSSTATASTRGVTVTNPDGGSSTKAAAFTVTNAPRITSVSPNSVTASPSAAVTLSNVQFVGTGFQTSGGNPTVSIPNLTVTVKSVNGSGTLLVADVTIPAGTPGAPRAVTVQNEEDKGTSSLASGFTVKNATALTSTRSPRNGVAGSAVTFTGKLTRPVNGAGISGARIIVVLDPDIGGTRSIAVTTGFSGTWTLRFAPVYNTTVSARFDGDADDAAVQAARYKMGVAPRITRTSPASGASSPASSVLVVKGSIYPNKAGRTIGLYRGSAVLARATVASNGTYTFNVRLARGTHTLRIGIGATPGNIAGFSTSFVIRRT